MSFDDIIILVKESINTHGDIFQNDEIILDSNAVDHIADDIATALCGARDEPADVPVRHLHYVKDKYCSICDWEDKLFEHYKYCPGYGTKMDGKERSK